MKFLVDENVGSTVLKHLRKLGFEARSASELYPSKEDLYLFKIASQEKLIIITSDKDFGYLAFKTKFPPPAVILFRIRDESPEQKIKLINAILQLPENKILNHFIVADEKKIRIRPLELLA
jgi:predicted nuclease of predicted toxin-antitoxin system